jgi:hypothetical protein
MLEIRTAIALIGNQRPHQTVKHYSFTSYRDIPKQGVTSAAASALSTHIHTHTHTHTHTINVTQLLDCKMLLPATSYHPLGWNVHSSPLSHKHTSMSTVRVNVFFYRNSRMDGFICKLRRSLYRIMGINKLGIRHKDF